MSGNVARWDMSASQQGAPEQVFVANTDFVPGAEIVEVLGVVRGNTVRAKHLGRDIAAVLKSIIGGEIKGYSELMTEAREEALSRMQEEAAGLGADAVVNVRFETSDISGAMAELLAYGTAVRLESV